MTRFITTNFTALALLCLCAFHTKAQESTSKFKVESKMSTDLAMSLKDEQPKHSVHPNPFDELIHISSKESGQFSLQSASGKEVKSGMLVVGENELSMDNLPSGLYMLEINSTSGEFLFHFAR